MEVVNDRVDTWCPIPWVGLGVRSVGDLRYCCHANGSAGKGLLAKADGGQINLAVDPIADGINAAVIKDVRLAMLKGERYDGCRRCYIEEDAKIFSRRQSEIVTWEKYGVTKEKSIQWTKVDGAVDEKNFPLMYIDLRFGNRCNLKCRMCGPTESDKWYEGHVKVWGHTQFKEGDRRLEIMKDKQGRFQLKNDPYKWYDSDRFWSDLESHMPQLKRIYLAGGEPFLIDAQFELLNRCVEKGYAKSITLEYNSNITALTDKMLNIWKNFYKVEIGVSIDGIGPINDYIRYPSKWDVVATNLATLDVALGNFKLWWAATIQIYNMLHLPELMLWIVKQKYARVNTTIQGKEILTSHQLSNPNYLSIRAFPEKSKLFIAELFETSKVQAREEIFSHSFYTDEEKQRLFKRFSNILDHYIVLMNGEDLSHLKDKFWHYTNKLDELNGTSLRTVCPQTHELMM